MHKPLQPLPTIPLGKYRHYRGYEYDVIAVGRYEATEEPVVVYRALYSVPDVGAGAVWVRPVAEFLAKVEVDGKTVPRFIRLK